MKYKATISMKVILMLHLFLSSAIGQVARNQPLSYYIQSEETKGWINFTEDNLISPTKLFADFKKDFGLGKDDDMRIIKTATDELGFTHIRFQQYYKSKKVIYAEYIVHTSADGRLKSANGQLLSGLNLNSNAMVTEKTALVNALQFVNARMYLWQNDDAESHLKSEKKDIHATYYPVGELVYAPANNNQKPEPSDYKLAWSFEIYTADAFVPAKRIFIDALTGAILSFVDISMTCSAGTGTTTFNGTRNINSLLVPGVGYSSSNICHTTTLTVYNCNGGAQANNLYVDSDNDWSNQQSAAQCQFATEQTYIYYFNNHSRESWDNAAGTMVAYNNSNIPGLGLVNACWGCTGNSAAFGAGSTAAANDDWNTLDIVGHEFTHGVTQATSNLNYNHESGALNESFSDIFGEMVESWTLGTCDWLVGDEIGAIRSFDAPSNYTTGYGGAMPDTYLGTGWYSGSSDNYGVHHNSSVQNYIFFMLSEGDWGQNDYGITYNVTGIGRFKARNIAYRALTVYLISTSGFVDARAAWIQAAKDLYGNCSNEAIQTGLAWRAAGVYTSGSPFQVTACGNYPANGTIVQAADDLTAGGGCNTTITANPNTVYFAAADQIFLFNGFTALNGSNFIAYIEPCSNVLYRSAGPVLSDAEKNVMQQKTVPSDPTNAIEIYPNPANEFFTISIKGTTSHSTIKIFNSTLQLEKVIHFDNGTEKQIPISDLPAGIYFIDAQSGDQIYKTKFIISR
ncbi:MAG: M4 family metallopeptidase [Chitinophagales bacterium]